ncbi:hypothetical protein Esi_0196_0056 [Ectocarpus siliculosus]|uniref:Uncharacterized protein n=1 Tax=Ectocarpus siliculosus TaxID=2880 RepID=D8LHK9_ECTSI|nr:hypothetical protein Esi_0196_0056 [Ectocarpus siliculosus]|eukprot:CBN79291.1 hypothetical protein Esi_0196_0056 [Ectocarpus siliculosus]
MPGRATVFIEVHAPAHFLVDLRETREEAKTRKKNNQRTANGGGGGGGGGFGSDGGGAVRLKDFLKTLEQGDEMLIKIERTRQSLVASTALPLSSSPATAAPGASNFPSARLDERLCRPYLWLGRISVPEWLRFLNTEYVEVIFRGLLATKTSVHKTQLQQRPYESRKAEEMLLDVCQRWCTSWWKRGLFLKVKSCAVGGNDGFERRVLLSSS